MILYNLYLAAQTINFLKIMTRITLLLMLLISTLSIAQTPDAFNYQSAVRDGAGDILASQNIGVEIQIRQGGATGTTVYTETHNVTTNAYGIFDLAVGTGTTSDTFSAIAWDTNTYWMQVSIDATGGTTYSLLGASQLLSVPYAINSKTDNDWNVTGNNMVSNVSGNVGIGVSVPATKFHLQEILDEDAAFINGEQQTFGNALQANTVYASNGSSTIYVVNGGNGMGVNIEHNNTAATSRGLQVANTGLAEAAFFNNDNPANTSSVLTVNQETPAGNGIEIQTTGTGNTDPTGHFNHFGTGTSVFGINQNETPTAVITVGDFIYTGSDLRDHIGVRGFSAPATNYGIGVEGLGEWYGVHGVGTNFAVFGTGNTGATGTKSFVIDHPLDPANKTLKHYSIESNEVLNMYRGNATLDGNGNATIELPQYFDAINKNFSYQLTAIGTPEQPYIAKEINNNTFTISGKPNTKVSWVVYANRNDLHIQNNKEKLVDEIEKPAHRKGQYYNPEYYGQPVEKRIGYKEQKVVKSTKKEATIEPKQ